MLVAMDGDLSIRDLTFPYVGLHNHVSGNYCRIGIWAGDQFAWLSDPRWQRSLRYEADTLITNSVFNNGDLAITLSISDCICHQQNILLRQFKITSTSSSPREVRLFLSHCFHIAETDIGDTAFFNPFVDSMVHYKRDNYFLISGSTSHEGIYEYTTGVFGFNGAEGTWRDAEDGNLSMNPVQQGSVDSTISFRATINPGETTTIRAWLCAGHTLAEVTHLHYKVINSGFDQLRQQTRSYWAAWSKNETISERLNQLPTRLVDLFRRSLLIIRTQIDNRGAIIAANDSDIMSTIRANYSYMWPRDGALVAASLDRLGYQDITRRFFEFCKQALPCDRAALMHKYSADGSWGASWHPWVVGNHNEVPFQQDSTALVIYALWQHFIMHNDLEYIEHLYDDFIVPASDFMVQYRDPDTSLPLPSYDLWEERRGVHAYTCGTVYGALFAASKFAALFNDDRSESYLASANELRKGIVTHLWSEEHKRFARRLVPTGEGKYEKDMIMDSAAYALFAFGALPPDHPKLVSSMDQTFERLQIQSTIGGTARYEQDYYFNISEDFGPVPGNPWIICTLWQAQYHIAKATELLHLEQPLSLLNWTADRAAESGILPEQVDPYTGQHLSVSPLTWSHAEFVSTCLQYLDKLDILHSSPVSV